MPDADLALFDMEPLPIECNYRCAQCHKSAHKQCLRPRKCHGTAEQQTAGQARRAKQEALIAVGLHPLSYLAAGLRTIEHPVTEATPSCADCRFREQVHGGSRAYPKCLRGYERREIPESQRITKYGPTHRIITPFATHGEASDCRAWWPACSYYEPRETANANDG